MPRLLLAALLALALPSVALAHALLASRKGDVLAGGAPMQPNQRIFAGATVSAGGAQALLRFDDGMQVVLNENARLQVVDFSLAAGRLADRVVLELQMHH